jgi:hypothetical protein
MTGLESDWLRPSPSLAAGETRFRVLSLLAGVVFFAYLAATLLGASGSASSLAFNVLVLPVPFVVWWAYARATESLRRTVHLCAWAATLWLAGSLVWYGYFLAGGSVIPKPPGTWDAFFVAARLLVIVAIIVATRSFLSLRLAAFDACVIVAAGLAVGAAFAGRGLGDEVTAASLFTLNRPILGIVTLMLIVSAALGSWEGLPRSIALLGLGEVGITIGSLIYSYAAVHGAYVDNRWANLAWGSGAEISMLAAAVIILGIDRPVRLGARSRIPKHAGGSRAVLLVSLGALASTLGVACYGELTGRRTLGLLGLAASVSIGAAMALRARDSIRTVEAAYARLDLALAETERARDELTLANDELGRANVGIRAMHIAFADLLNLADERTDGRMRALVEETGSELAELLEEQMEPERGR